MIEPAARFLFVPVSGPFGKGEYARSLAIARGVVSRWPTASIRFVLSREAPYAASTPYPTTLLDASPTFHPRAVATIIATFRPHVVIFDNAGRTSQLRAARAAGARVVFVSARARQRRKAFRLRWMTLIDEHWIAYPRFVAGGLSVWERIKLALIHRPAVRYLDVILDSTLRDPHDSVLDRLSVTAGEFVLMVPGGGTGHPGARGAVGQFLQAARALAATGVVTVFVGAAPAESDAGSDLRTVESLPQADLARLMRRARLIVANGGSTLLQSIACAKPCIAVPIAKDQSERIARCVKVGVTLAAPLESAAILALCLRLFGDEALQDALTGRAVALGLRDGVEVALQALDSLLTARVG